MLDWCFSLVMMINVNLLSWLRWLLNSGMFTNFSRCHVYKARRAFTLQVKQVLAYMVSLHFLLLLHYLAILSSMLKLISALPSGMNSGVLQYTGLGHSHVSTFKQVRLIGFRVRI